MTTLYEIVRYLDTLLAIDKFTGDCSNNGLQVEGNSEVEKIVFGVDACAALFAEAADRDADMVFVHHGLSWGNGFKNITGNLAGRIKLLMNNNISLYAVHLPLDAHPRLGHNAILADMIGLGERKEFCEYAGHLIGFQGVLPTAMTLHEIAEIFADRLDCCHSIYGDEDIRVMSAGIVSGGGGTEAIIAAAKSQTGCQITLEITHQNFHDMLENAVPVISLGHYKTETPGVLAIMENLRETFNVECEFIDIPTGL